MCQDIYSIPALTDMEFINNTTTDHTIYSTLLCLSSMSMFLCYSLLRILWQWVSAALSYIETSYIVIICSIMRGGQPGH